MLQLYLSLPESSLSLSPATCLITRKMNLYQHVPNRLSTLSLKTNQVGFNSIQNQWGIVQFHSCFSLSNMTNQGLLSFIPSQSRAERCTFQSHLFTFFQIAIFKSLEIWCHVSHYGDGTACIVTTISWRNDFSLISLTKNVLFLQIFNSILV
jgi:hypothetical protein